MDYYKKYIKYKKKYLDYKNMIGGAGIYAFNYDTATMYILMHIGGDTLDRINERRQKLGLEPETNLHFTLLNLHINVRHPDFATIFKNKEFFDDVSKKFKETVLDGRGSILQSGFGEYGIIGDNNKFWVRKYNAGNTLINFEFFRREFYKLINTKLGISQKSERTITNQGNSEEFIFYKYKGVDLYAVSKNKYYGIHTWLPHVSIFKISELPNGRLKSAIENPSMTDENKTEIIKKAIGQVNPISVILLNNKTDGSRNDFNSLEISIKFNGNRTPPKLLGFTDSYRYTIHDILNA